jgi:hypothetical protein
LGEIAVLMLFACHVLELRRGLLAELAEALSGVLEVRAGGGRGPRQEPKRKAHRQRLDARVEREDPHRAAEHEVRRPAPQLDPEQQHQRHREQAGRPDQRHDVDRVAVYERYYDKREQVVRHDDGENERPQAVRGPPADQREQPQRERRVGRHRDAPALRSRAPRLNARSIAAAAPMPPTDASNGSTNRRRSRKSPRSNSRRASRPSTKKKNVISPLFTHSRSVSSMPCRRGRSQGRRPTAPRRKRRPR